MSELVDGAFFSSLIQKECPYRIFVPGLAPRTREPLPVLYLLHGLFGSFRNWSDLTGVQRYLGELGLLVVMPEGGDSWYTDGEEKYESYLIRDLIPEIESRFGGTRDRGARLIAGNSMGGYGAMKFALKYPELFGFVASFSGAFHVPRLVDDSEGGEMTPSISRVFGDELSLVRKENDLFAIVPRLSGNAYPLPGIYFDCGIRDEFITANREFSEALIRAGVEHEFREIDGGHDWAYWDDRIRFLMSIVKEKF